MTFFYDVLDKLRLIVYIFIVSVMLSESHVERTTSLSNILFFGTSIDILNSCQILVFGFPAFPRVFSSYCWWYMPLSKMYFLNVL